MSKPTGAEIRGAFKWVAWWETVGADHHASDHGRNEEACEILSTHAYWVLVETANAWRRREVALDAGFDYEAGLNDVYVRAGLRRPGGSAPC